MLCHCDIPWRQTVMVEMEIEKNIKREIINIIQVIAKCDNGIPKYYTREYETQYQRITYFIISYYKSMY